MNVSECFICVVTFLFFFGFGSNLLLRIYICVARAGNEKEIGEVFKAQFSGSIARDSVFITSKLWNR